MSKIAKNYPKNLERLRFPLKQDLHSSLSIFSSPQDVPFPIRRVFVIKAEEACARGKHAHKVCHQLLVCLQGECTVTIDDALSRQTVTLNQANEGLLIPASFWAEQEYAPGTILMVFADQAYDEEDYIRDYATFLSWRRNIP